MDNLSVISVFLGGLVTFLAPCTFVTLPTFLTYLLGAGVKSHEHKNTLIKARILIGALSYALGFLIIFTLMGLAATSLGQLFRVNKNFLVTISAFVIILMGTFMLIGEKIPWLKFMYAEKKIRLKDFRSKTSTLLLSTHDITDYIIFPHVLGITSAIAWTPCIGPILGGVLLLAANQTSIFYGGFLLFVYGLGIMIPFVLIAYLFSKTENLFNKFKKITPYIYKFSAFILILLGLGMLFGLNNIIFKQMYTIFTFFGYSPP